MGGRPTCGTKPSRARHSTEPFHPSVDPLPVRGPVSTPPRPAVDGRVFDAQPQLQKTADRSEMSGQAARPHAPPANGPDAPEHSAGIGATMHKILRSIAIILILQAVFKYAGSYIKAPLKEDFAKPDAAKTSPEEHSARTVDPSHEQDYSVIPKNIFPLWLAPATIDIDVYVSEDRYFRPQGQVPFVAEKGIRAGDWKDTRTVTTTINFSQDVINNGSLYAHVFAYKSPGSERNQRDPELPAELAISSTHLLTRYMPRRRDTSVKKLIGGTSDEFEKTSEGAGQDIVSYYHPNFTLSLVGDAGPLLHESIHPVIRPLVHLEPTNSRDSTGLNGFYLPIVYENSFWLLRDHMYPINASVTEVPFYFELNQVSMLRMQIFNSLDVAVKQQSAGLGGSGAEFEEFKRIFLETNVWLLGTTVSLVRRFASVTDRFSLLSHASTLCSSCWLSRMISYTFGPRRTTLVCR